MHCFSGAWDLAETAMGLGFLISFAGNLTFKKANDLREIAGRIPLACLLVETDCPYLSPEPFRGRRNEPARVVEVARCLATIHDCDTQEIATLTSNNFATLFGL
jgi:TatD DNase family protein